MDTFRKQKIQLMFELFKEMHQNVSVCPKSQFGEIFSTSDIHRLSSTELKNTKNNVVHVNRGPVY